MARFLLVLVILLALVLAVFGAQNPEPVRIQFFGLTSGFVPLYVVILLSALAGVLLSAIFGLRSRVSSALLIRKQERRIADLERQLADHPAQAQRKGDSAAPAIVTDSPPPAKKSDLPKL